MQTNPRKTAGKKAPKKPVSTLEKWPGGVTKGGSLDKPAHPRYPWVVRWTGPGGRRMKKWFEIESEATSWAAARSVEVGEVGAAFGSLTEKERAAVASFRAFRASHDNPAPPELGEVVRAFIKEWKAKRSGAVIETAVDEYLESLRRLGRSDGHVATIEVRLGRFARDHAGRVLPSFTPREIGDWVLSLQGKVLMPAEVLPVKRIRADGTPVKKFFRPVVIREKGGLSLETRAGYRRALLAFFEWARKRGMVEDNPVRDAEKPEAPPKLPGVLTPDQVQRFFDAISAKAPELVPFWALRTFAGIREAEALRMRWHMIDLASGIITLPATITKTRTSREIKIEPVLRAYLAPHAQEDGPICELSPIARRWRMRSALRAVPGLVPPRNWARHTFATYHLLKFRHAGSTSMELGHKGDPAMLHAHYRGVGTEKQAIAFFDIRPDTPANVLDIEATAAEAPAEEQAKAEAAGG